MKNLILSIPLLAFFIIVFPSCGEEEEPAVTIDCTTVTYSGTIKALVSANCSSSNCHGAGAPNGDYTTYDKIVGVATNGRLNSEVVVQQSMPIGSNLTDVEIAQFKCWLDDGAPNN